MRIIARLQKGNELRFISHLDLQRLIQRALRRALIPVQYSLGFNPHPLLSFSSALSVGYTSDAEWIDVRVEDGFNVEEFSKRMNEALPQGARILEAREVQLSLPALTALIERAQYRIVLRADQGLEEKSLRRCIDELLSGEIMVDKRTKGGMKCVDIRPALIDMHVQGWDGDATLMLTGVLNASGGLPVELLMKALTTRLGVSCSWRVHRTFVYFKQLEV